MRRTNHKKIDFVIIWFCGNNGKSGSKFFEKRVINGKIVFFWKQKHLFFVNDAAACGLAQTGKKQLLLPLQLRLFALYSPTPVDVAHHGDRRVDANHVRLFQQNLFDLRMQRCRNRDCVEDFPPKTEENFRTQINKIMHLIGQNNSQFLLEPMIRNV